MVDLKQVKTEALAAAVPHIEPYQKAVKERHDFQLKTDTKYHAETVKQQLADLETTFPVEDKQGSKKFNHDRIAASKPGELNTLNSWTEEELKTRDKLNETVQGTSKKLEESMTPVMKKHGLSLESNKPSLDEMMQEKGKDREPNGRDIINQISGDLARQAIAPKTPEEPKAPQTPSAEPAQNKGTGR